MIADQPDVEVISIRGSSEDVEEVGKKREARRAARRHPTKKRRAAKSQTPPPNDNTLEESQYDTELEAGSTSLHSGIEGRPEKPKSTAATPGIKFSASSQTFAVLKDPHALGPLFDAWHQLKAAKRVLDEKIYAIGVTLGQIAVATQELDDILGARSFSPMSDLSSSRTPTPEFDALHE